MSKNFVAYADAQALMEEIGKQKLTVTDVMPAASPDLLDNTRLYIGADTASLLKGGIYQCQAVEVTPAGSENPQSEGWYVYDSVAEEYELTTDTSVVSGTTYYEIKWENISRAEVDLSKYKTIWGGTVEGWNQLSQAEQDEYDYCAFEDDATDYFAVVDAVTDGDMHPVTSNAVYNAISETGKYTLLATTNNTAWQSKQILLDGYKHIQVRVINIAKRVYATSTISKNQFLEKDSSANCLAAEVYTDERIFGESYYLNGTLYYRMNNSNLTVEVYGIS